MGHYFISYSTSDGLDFALRLRDELEAGTPSVPVWLDKRDIRPGQDWDEEIVAALKSCAGLIFIMTRASTHPNSVCKQEWMRALKYEKLIIPIKLHPDAELPFRLEPRQYLDFTLAVSSEDEFNAALARLRLHLKSLAPLAIEQAAVVSRPTHTIQEPPLEIRRQSEPPPKIKPEPITKHATASKLRVALLYKRHAQPDEQILSLLETTLCGEGYEVFIDRHMSIGVEWAQEIERQVRSADAVVPLLSAASVSSEMLAYEVQTAYDAAQKQSGKPRLLPVRINFDEALPSALGTILNPLQYATWYGPHDNQRLQREILNSLRSPASKPVDLRKLEPVGGAVPLDSKFYIVRPTDDDFLAAIERRDSIVLVKGARQMGKTSLLARGLKLARENGGSVVFTDFQGLNASHFESVETLYMALAELIADQLDLDVLPQKVWNSERGPSVNFQRYLRREVLGKISGPLVWGLDEVDRLFTCPFGSEVFGLFRSWHNARSLDPDGPWRDLTMAIAYATEAHLFISDLNQSPFNVGTRLALEDFNFEQVTELNARYGSPLKDQTEVSAFNDLVSGHPYLVRRGLHEMASRSVSITAFSKQAALDEGPFGDHLRRFLVLLAQDVALCDVMREVLCGHPCPTTESFYRLSSAGLLAGSSVHEARPRCQLYKDYLSRHLL